MQKRITFNFTLPVYKRRYKPLNIPIFDELDKNVAFTFSGKSAICLLLKYYREIGRLIDKSDQILVPHWLGTWIYMTIHQYCFPTTIFNKKVKALFVYHQWGFPQQMDKIKKFCKDYNLFCIEDCAHSYKGYYHGKRLGTLSDASVFSLAKFFPSVVGGAVYSRNRNILNFIKYSQQANSQHLSKEAFDKRVLFDAKPENAMNQIDLIRSYSIYDRLLKCPDYSVNVVQHELKNGSLKKRTRNFNLFREAFDKYDYMEDLFKENIIPWIIPLFFSKKTNRIVADKLSKNNIESGIYNFDVNRNMLNPDFRECVAVPCHQGLSIEDICKIIELIRRKT